MSRLGVQLSDLMRLQHTLNCEFARRLDAIGGQYYNVADDTSGIQTPMLPRQPPQIQVSITGSRRNSIIGQSLSLNKKAGKTESVPVLSQNTNVIIDSSNDKSDKKDEQILREQTMLREDMPETNPIERSVEEGNPLNGIDMRAIISLIDKACMDLETSIALNFEDQAITTRRKTSQNAREYQTLVNNG